MALEKPSSVASSPVKSAKWDELTAGRDFRESDVPTLSLLCQWHAIVERCMDDLDTGGDIAVAYTNDMNDVKALPQVGMLKQASAEIRALNKQLGINDEAAPVKAKVTTLEVLRARRAERVSKSAC